MIPEILPDQSLAAVRRKLNNQLESIKVMLVHKRNYLPSKDWESFVVLTRECILAQPDQYLDKDLPALDILRTVVTTLFDEFMEREKPTQ